MKKIISLIISVIMILSVFSACSSSDETTREQETTNVPAQSETVTEKEETEPETESATETEQSVDTFPVEVKPEDYLGTYYGENGVMITVGEGGSGVIAENGVEYEAFWIINEGEFVIWDNGDHAFSGSLVKANTELSGLWKYTDHMKFSADPSVVTEPTYSEPPYNPVVFEPITVELYGGFKITVLGAELFRDDEHGEAIRVYYDVENTSSESKIVSNEIITYLTWDIYDVAHCKNYNSEEASAFNDAVEPGKTVRCASEFVCNWEREDVYVFEIQHDLYRTADLFGAVDTLEPGNYTISAEFRMQELPALPEGGLPEVK